MNKLPPLNLKRPLTIQNPKFFQTESDETKLPQMKNFDIAIDYYTQGINNDRTNTLFLIKRAICYLAKGFYSYALKDALRSIEINPSFSKGYYIASLSYLEMYDLENAERFMNESQSINKKQNNQRLMFLLEKTKAEIKRKCQKFKLFPKYLFFLRELYKYDAFFPKLEIHFYSNDSRGVISRSSIQKNEIIMTIPKTCLISLETALTTPMGKSIGEFMYKDLNSPKHCLLSAFLLTEEKNDKWKFYFDLLPKDFSNFPIFYTEKEVDILKGSPVLRQIYEKKKDIKQDYDTICQYIPGFSKFSFLKFCKARMLISSRIFGVTIEDKATDILAPFADLLNHKRPRQTQWYYDDQSSAFIIQATEDIPEKVEVFDSYGKKTNTRFLLNYGFAIDNNEISEYQFTLKLNENFPMFEEKKKILQTEYEYTKKFRLKNVISESEFCEFLSFLRFLLFDGDISILYAAISTDQDYEDEDDYEINFYDVAPISLESEVEVLQYFHYLCKDALRKYPTTYEEDRMLLKTKKNISFNMRNCLLVITGEKKVLEYYMYFCEYCLMLFKKNEYEIISKINKDYKYNECEFEFYIQNVILKLIK